MLLISILTQHTDILVFELGFGGMGSPLLCKSGVLLMGVGSARASKEQG